jgi:hypothetical protein
MTPNVDFSFDNVKNLFMPYVNVLQNNNNPKSEEE